MTTFEISDGREILLPQRRHAATIESVRKTAARHGLEDVGQECRAHCMVEWDDDLAWLEAVRQRFELLGQDELRLKEVLRHRSQAIWGEYADVCE